MTACGLSAVTHVGSQLELGPLPAIVCSEAALLAAALRHIGTFTVTVCFHLAASFIART
jgi:hypothetical protein